MSDLTPRFLTDAAPQLPPPGARLLLAVSGGADSMALLDCCARAARWPLTVWHLDHGLRPEAAEDAAAVAAGVARWRAAGADVTLIAERADVAALARGWRCGVEAAGRRHRYARLAAVARDLGAAAVLTAHHRDDQAETVLANLLRGAGPVGQGGIAPRRDLGGVPLTRPLLGFGRDELRAHLVANGVAWREDATNTDRRFRRNDLRHRVLPDLERVAPGIGVDLAALADATRRRHADDVALAGRLWREGVEPGRLRLDAVAAAPEPARWLVWRDLLRYLGTPMARRHLRQLDALAFGPPGRRYHLGKWLLLRRRDAIGWEEAAPPVDAGSVAIPGHGCWVRGRTVLTVISSHLPADPDAGSAFEAYLDQAGLAWPLVWRCPLPGERFVPLGAPGHQTVTKFLAGRGVPSRLRPLVPVIADQQGIVWVPGFGVAERAKVSSATAETVHLVFDVQGRAE